jgi:AcrR family transcriptional regulator
MTNGSFICHTKAYMKAKQSPPKPKPTRPTRASRRKDARPAELIEAGLQEFALNGFAATRMEDVATRAGVAKGTIYRYFSDKEALFEATVRATTPEFTNDVHAVIDAFEGTTKELLTYLLTRMYAEVGNGEMRALMRVLLSEIGKFPSLGERYYVGSVARIRPFLEKVVARGVARGEIRPDHPKLLPLLIAAPVIMASVWKMTFEPFDPLATEDLLEAHLHLLLHGLLVESPSPAPSPKSLSSPSPKAADR